MTAACSPEAVTCAVRTGVPIHVTFLHSMSQWPAQLPVLLSATGWLCPRSSPESHRKWADRSHSSLRVELEDRIKGLIPALPQLRPFIYRQLTNILLPLLDETWKDTTVNACFKRKCIPWSVEDQERDCKAAADPWGSLAETLPCMGICRLDLTPKQILYIQI